MPYTVYKTNGVKLTTIEDGQLNLTTDLQLVGKNYAGYGQIVNENFVKLLENFANGSAPENPLVGQIWYDTISKALKVWSGTKWDQYSSTAVTQTRPVDLKNGEFWFDSSTQKLYVRYNNSYVLIGPSSGGSGGGGGGTGGAIGTNPIISDSNITIDAIKLAINDGTIAIISPSSFNISEDDPLYSYFSYVKNGITLQGANPTTGVSSTAGTYFWGTAADSLRLNGFPASDYLKQSDVSGIVSNNLTELGSIVRISSGSPSTPGQIEGAWTLTSGSTLESTYADLAERYEADAAYEPGTVLMIGGEKEVTICDEKWSVRVAGVVSSNPAFKLNSDAGTDDTHPYIALKGRIPCKVVGVINKGDLLVASGIPGVAQSGGLIVPDANTVIGKALANYSSQEVGLIDIKV